jgi:hypothetical protein
MYARHLTPNRFAAGLMAASALLVAPFATQAEEAAAGTITVDCARPSLPSQQDIARLTGVDNFGQAYRARARLMVDAQRACQSPIAKVRLVLAPAPERKLAAR